MKVRILPAALKDLEIGSQFYEEQEPGIGQQKPKKQDTHFSGRADGEMSGCLRLDRISARQ